MTIENTLQSIATSLERIADALSKQAVVTAPETKKAKAEPTPVIAPPMVAPTPMPAPAPVTTPAPVAAPVEVAPAPGPAVIVAPPVPTSGAMSKDDFTKVLMSKYQQLGPVDGTRIQEVMAKYGHRAVNTIPVEQYAAIAAEVSAL